MASATVVLLVCAAGTASAALQRPTVVQLDGVGRVALDVSADGRYALTGPKGSKGPLQRISMVTGRVVTLPFGAVNPHLTADGATLYFDSTARLVPDDTDHAWDLYRYDFGTKAIALIPLANRPPDSWWMRLADINADGSIIAFSGYHLKSLRSAVWLYDAGAGIWRRPDWALPGASARTSVEVSLSASGRIAAFTSGRGFLNVWVYYWGKQRASLVSVRADGTMPFCHSEHPDISPDGTWITFVGCPGMAGGADVGKDGVFVRNRITRVTSLVSDHPYPSSFGPSIAANGAYVVLLELRASTFEGVARTLPQPVAYRIATGRTMMLDAPKGGGVPNGDSWNVKASSAGRSVVFTSSATNFSWVSEPARTDVVRVFWSVLPR